MRLAQFSLHFARNRMTPCVPNVHGNHYTSTYFILLSDRLIFRNSLSLEKKRVRVTAHYACVNVHVAGTCPCIKFVNAGDLE